MAPQCDSLEDNAEGFGAKKKKKRFYQKRFGVMLPWKMEADLGLDEGRILFTPMR